MTQRKPLCANLHSANLCSANLRSADLNSADLEGIRWDADTKWEGVKGLETAVNVPEALKQQLGMEGGKEKYEG